MSPFSSVATGWGAVRTVWFVHGLGVLESSFLACSALAARSLRNSRKFRLPGIGEPSAANLMRPNLLGSTGRGFGSFIQVQFGPPTILLWFCSGMSFMAGAWLLAAACYCRSFVSHSATGENRMSGLVCVTSAGQT